MGRHKVGWKQKLEVAYQAAQEDVRWAAEPVVCIAKLVRQLEELRKNQSTAASNATNAAAVGEEERLRSFEQWLLQHGAAGPAAAWSLAVVPGKGTGVIASQPIEAGAEVTKIPRSIMFTAASERARVHSLSALLQEPLIKSTPTLELAVILAHHMLIGEDSLFAAYIQVLPKEFDTPLFWTPHTFQMLHSRGLDTLLTRAVGSVRAAVVQYYHVWQAIRRLDGAGALNQQNYTWDLHRRALCAIVTRQNAIPDYTGEKSMLALIPGWDMANHEFGDLTTFFDMEQDSLSLNAMRAFQPGEEVTMCYGRRNNEELLLYSGFCAPGNPYDAVKVRINLVEDEILKIRQMLWARHSGNPPLTGPTVDIALGPTAGDEPSHEALLAAVCATVSKQDATTMLRASQGGVMEVLCQLSEGAPAVALQYLRDTLKEAVGKLDAAGADAAGESKSDVAEATAAISEQERRLDGYIDVIAHSTRHILSQHMEAVDKLLASFS